MTKLTCQRCVLDSKEVPDLKLDDAGVCNYCCDYDRKFKSDALTSDQRNILLDSHLNHAKSHRGKYDCILGLSGGVDSSYLALLAKEWGLNPLLYHFDNGWNSELAVKNIQGIVEYTGFDLYTYVVDWEEFKEIQRSYILSGVLDWEMPTDHGFMGALYRLALKRNIRTILVGTNHQTEAILPKSMTSNKRDFANFSYITQRFGNVKIDTFPFINKWKLLYYNHFCDFHRFDPLNLVPYDKQAAKRQIIEKMGWTDYGGKHYESIFTRFYQGYVLPNKFGIDKRKAHLSNLICSAQITRAEAIEELKKDPYPDTRLKEEDKTFVMKKLGFTEEEFDDIMNQEPVPHQTYPTIADTDYARWSHLIKSFKYYTSRHTWKRYVTEKTD